MKPFISGLFSKFGYGMNVPIKTVSYDLHVPSWPRGMELSVALLADLHIGLPHMGPARIEEAVNATNALGCDLIALMGDYVGTSPLITAHVPDDVWVDIFSKLQAPLGVYGVEGNHDWKYDIARVRSAFAKASIPLLQNDALRLKTKAGQAFWLLGLGSHLGAKPISGPRISHADIPATLSKITDDAPALMMMHEPHQFDALPARVPIAFSGHTHGGQVHLPFVGRPIAILDPKGFKTNHMYGVVQNTAGGRMVITAGVGWSTLPLRIGVPPEIVKVRLRGGGD